MSKNMEPVLFWDGMDKNEPVPPCTLTEEPDKSYGDAGCGSMLIQAENLSALKALLKNYAGKIKLAYLDPPYNTGSALEHYDDSVSHCSWLSFMKARLEAVKALLKPDGVIAVQIGFDEMAYLKVLMDGVFGREKCIGQIAVRMSHSAGMKRRALDRRIIKNTEYILMYYNTVQPKLNPVYEPCGEYPVNYYQYITAFPDGNGKKGKYVNLADILYEKFRAEFVSSGLKKSNSAIKVLYAQFTGVRNFIIANKDRVVRRDSNVPKFERTELIRDLCPDEFTEADINSVQYYIGRNRAGNYYQLYSLSGKIKVPDGGHAGGETLTNLAGDWWDGFYRDMSRVDTEGGVKMKTSKKPERLIARIVSAVTEPGDTVLDPFLGSGTTAAAALKTGRKFIGIENGAQCETLCLPRLKRVVEGRDPTGITRAAGWQGGAGFRFFSSGGKVK